MEVILGVVLEESTDLAWREVVELGGGKLDRRQWKGMGRGLLSVEEAVESDDEEEEEEEAEEEGTTSKSERVMRGIRALGRSKKDLIGFLFSAVILVVSCVDYLDRRVAKRQGYEWYLFLVLAWVCPLPSLSAFFLPTY